MYEDKLGLYGLSVRARACADGETVEWELIATREQSATGEPTLSPDAMALASGDSAVGFLSSMFGFRPEGAPVKHVAVLSSLVTSEEPQIAIRRLIGLALGVGI